MPSTEYFGYTLTNIGPLTTTFTPAASCATNTADYVVGDDERTPLVWRPDCTIRDPDEECVPSASALIDLHESWTASSIGQGFWPYYSPGLDCPSGWSTAGAVASESGKETLSASGIFAQDTYPFENDTHIIAAALPAAAVIRGAIEAGETAVWCCPSGHSADVYGQCLSTVGTYDVKKYPKLTRGCQIFLGSDNVHTFTTFDGTTWDPPLLSVDLTVDEKSTVTEPITELAFDTSSLNVLHTAGVIAMIHQASDLEEAGKGDKGGDGKDDDGDGAQLARSLSIMSLAVTVIGFLAGVGVLLPW